MREGRDGVIDFGLVDAVDAEAIGLPGQRTFRLRVVAGDNRAALWMEKEQLAALGRAISRLLAERGGRRASRSRVGEVGAFGPDADVEFRVVRLGLDYEQTGAEGEGNVVVLVDDEDALQSRNTPAFRMALRRDDASALVAGIAEVVSAGRPLCPLCGRPLEGSGEHFCPGSNGHSEHADIPDEEIGDS